MIYKPQLAKTRFFRLAHVLLCLTLLLGFLPVRLYAAPTAAMPQAPNACPASPASLPSVIERTDFCVYFNTANTTNAQATTVADHTQAYWDRYVTDFGFRVPNHTSKLEVQIVNAADCNGGTSFGTNVFTVNNGCFGIAESMQQTPGHELFHRVQYSYDGNEVRWFKEGTARTMEDLAFTNIDHWVNALSAPFNFNLQSNEYLNNTNVDITSDPQRYNSALWWKYFTEQFGAIATEPQRGVDALLRLWEAAETQNDIAALNQALTNLGAGMNFDAAFQHFTAANWIKDLSNQPSAAYNYVDEDEAGNPSATFHTDAGPAFYHVITQKGNALDSFSSNSATDWTQAFFNDGLTKIVAIAGSTTSAAQSDLTLSCVTPVVDIKLPNNGAVMRVGAHDGPGKFLAQVLVTNGSPNGPVVAGLSVNDFKAKVNGQNALVTDGGFIQEQYWLVIQAPNQTADGTYDLEITLEKSGTATAIASDTNPTSVAYTSANTDHLLVLDRSGSMLSDNKMIAARAAANFYVDITRNNDGVAVVPFNQNVSPAPFNLRAVTTAPNVRQQAKDYINAITASGATSIGDGLQAAVNQRTASPTGNVLCSYILLSDGMENDPLFWSTVQGNVIASHCPVTTIAFGPETDETLMQNIATATGGLYFYNDVFVSSSVAAANANGISAAADTALDLGSTYEYAQAGSENRQRLLAEKGSLQSVVIPRAVGATTEQVHKVLIDDSVSEALFALDWPTSQFPLDLKLRKPDGTLIDSSTLPYTFIDYNSGHVGWRISQPEPGTWELLVDFHVFPAPGVQAATADSPAAPAADNPYQVIVSGKSNLSLQLLLPDRLGSRYFTGNRLPIYAFVSGEQPIAGLTPLALVTAPNGVESRVPLFDDGQHGDGEPGDGFYAGFYTLVNQAAPVTPTGEDIQQPQPKDEGSYRVRLLVQTAKFTREALGSFSVQEGADTNGNGLPDPFEQENQVTQDGGDPDLDGLDNLSEYQTGTDPNQSDTDGGGENDGSEIAKGKNPFNPQDDSIVAPQFLHVTPNIGLNLVEYDVRPAYNRMLLYRATSPTGPWSLEQPELPTTGVYSDTATNGTTYYYRFMAINANDNRSAVIGASPVTPSQDPFQPEAQLLINNDAPQTDNLNVVLNFAPYGEEADLFTDIVEMKVSNDSQLTGANWEPFNQNKPWQLPPTPAGQVAKVYAQFRDAAHNESLVVLDGIMVQGGQVNPSNSLFLPFVTK
ncbi:MAG: VWA domain-containing protein [Chloroflexi bacterium]|nr:VWA domain-containing protein [Chloroflexota bacterium]